MRPWGKGVGVVGSECGRFRQMKLDVQRHEV